MEPIMSKALMKFLPTLIIGTYNEIQKNLFDKNIENLVVDKTDFESIIKEKILFEEFPEIETRLLIPFLKSDDVKLIVRHIYFQNFTDKNLEEIKEDFCSLFSHHFGVISENSNQFASNLFEVFIEGCQITLKKAISEGNLAAHDANTQFSLQQFKDGVKIIANNVDSIKVDVSTLLEQTHPKEKIEKFLNWTEYFYNNEKYLLPTSSFKISKFDTYLDISRDFIVSQSSNILLIHSSGSYGKSHLLREIAYNINQIDHDIEVLMVTPGFPEITDAIQNEIIKGKKYLLIFDDADRSLNEITPLLSHIVYKNKNIKVILAARTVGLQNIRAIISQLRCEEFYEELKIEKWSNNDLIQLLRFVADKDQVDDEEIIVNTYPLPHLIVFIGEQIKNKSTIDFNKIKIKFVNEIKHETEHCLKDILPSAEIKDVILNISLIVPFSKIDKTILSILSDLLGVSDEKVVSVLDCLEKAEILRVVGNSLRFNADIKGDLYLAYNLKDVKDYSIFEKLIERWMPEIPEKILMNLKGASKYEEIDILKKYMSNIVNLSIENAEKTSGYHRKESLKLLEIITEIVPENCLNLLYTYLDVPLPESSELLEPWLNDISPTTDDYGPIIIKLLKIDYPREDILNLIYEIDTKKIEGTYDNYKADRLYSFSVSPIENNLDIINETLDIFQSWVDSSDKSINGSISAALSEILSGTHQYSKDGFGKTTWGTKYLIDSSELVITRNKAIDLLKKMIEHQSLNVRLSAIQIAGNVGRTFGSVSENKLALSSKIADERKYIIQELKHLISPSEDFRLLSMIENLFLKWWAQEKNGTDEVKDVLRDFPQNPDYIVFKYFSSMKFVIEDFASIEGQAPEDGRWKWFIDNFMHKSFQLKSIDFRILVTSLNEKYNTEEQIIEYFNNLNQIVEFGHVGTLILDCWIRTNLDIFSSIRKNTSQWDQIPDTIKNIIDFTIADLNKDFIKELAHEVLSPLPNTELAKVDNFLRLLGLHSVEETLINSWISELIEKGTTEIRSNVVQYLNFIFGKNLNFNSIISFSQLAISKEAKLNSNFIENLVISTKNALTGHEEDTDTRLLIEFKKDLLHKLTDIPTLDWYAQELLEFSFVDIDSVIDFLESRLLKFKEKKDYSTYETIPFKGLDCIKYQILSFDDYDKLLNRFMVWYEDNDSLRIIYSLNDLLKPIVTMQNEVSGKLYIEEYIEKQLEQEDIKKAIFMSKYLPFEENTVHTLIKVAEKSISSGNSKDIKEILHHHINLEGGWTNLPGETSPDLLSKKTIFLAIHEEVRPGLLKMFTAKCIEDIDNRIIRSLKSDEEFLHSRR